MFANTDLTSTGFRKSDTGWMGRHFEQRYPDYLINPPEAPAAIQIGQFGSLVFQGDETNYAFDQSCQKGQLPGKTIFLIFDLVLAAGPGFVDNP